MRKCAFKCEGRGLTCPFPQAWNRQRERERERKRERLSCLHESESYSEYLYTTQGARPPVTGAVNLKDSNRK